MKKLTNCSQHLALANLDGLKAPRELSQEECSIASGGLRMPEDGDSSGSGGGSLSVRVYASGGTNDSGTANFVGTVLTALFVFSLF